jgi:RNA polymerase sigma-70 factor (ECF subfamily)
LRLIGTGDKGGRGLSTEWEIEKWFIDYGDDVYNYLVYYTGSTDVEDMVQEVFIKAIKGMKNFKGLSTPKTWLFTIARYTALDCFRRRKRLKLVSYSDTGNIPEQCYEMDEKLLLDEEVRYLYKAITNLKQNYKDVVLLRGIKGFSPSETAEILKWSETRVNVTLHRALKLLKKQLA